MGVPLKLITQPESWAKEAQPHVIETLELWLASAKAGELVSIVAAGETVDGMTMTVVSPSPHRALLLGALSNLQYRINRSMDEEH